MSIDFEDDLRTQLRSTTTPDLGIDTDEVITRGHGAVTRRNLLRGGLGLGVLGVVGVGAAVVADRMPGPAQPAEGGKGDWVSVDFDRLPDSWGVVNMNDPKVIRIEVNRAAKPGAQEASVRFKFSDPQGKFGSGWMGSDVPEKGASWGHGGDDDCYIVGLVVGKPNAWWLSVTGGHVMVDKPVPGTNLTAFVIRVNDPKAKSSLDKLYWIDVPGNVHNQYGSLMPTTSPSVNEAQVFVDSDQKVWGLVSGIRMVVQPLTGEVPLPIAIDDDKQRVRAVLLPAAGAAADAETTVTDPAKQWTSSYERLGDRAVVIATGPAKGGTATLTWTVNGKKNELPLG